MGKIVITGASSAIGWAITKELSLLNKPMLLHGNKRKELPINELSSEAEFVAADFSSPAELQNFINKLNNTEILINAAAYTVTELIPQISDESIEKMIAVNITALVKICRSVIPSMCLNRSGNIINISSSTATKVYRGQGVYAGTKVFSETFAKTIAAEYGTKGIRCNCVAPGAINTGHMKIHTNIAGNQIKHINAMNRLGKPEDIAQAVAFLCREENTYINGSVIHIDGGQWIGI